MSEEVLHCIKISRKSNWVKCKYGNFYRGERKNNLNKKMNLDKPSSQFALSKKWIRKHSNVNSSSSSYTLENFKVFWVKLEAFNGLVLLFDETFSCGTFFFSFYNDDISRICRFLSVQTLLGILINKPIFFHFNTILTFML